MDKFDSMRIFIRVAEMASFTKAAESLGMPKASVSTSVQTLESALGTRLLHRTTRKVQMSQDGLTFYERCKDLLAEVDDVETMFQKNAALIKGRIRVDMPVGFARDLVVPNLPGFLQEFPAIEIELSCTDRKVDVIREGFDCVLRVGLNTDSSLIARKLGSLTLVNCASNAYLKKHGVPKRLNDLTEHQFIHYVSTLGAKPDGFEYFDGEKYRTVKSAGRVIVNNADAYLSSCLAGLGIIQVPLVGAKAHLKAGTLIEVLPKFRAEPMPVSLLYPHRRQLARRVQWFMDWMEKLLLEYAQ